MLFFTLVFLPAQSAQVPVLAKNVTLDRGEYHLLNNGAQFFPILKIQGGQMRFIAHPHPRGTSGSSSPNTGATTIRASAPPSISATAAAASASAFASAAAAAASISSASSDAASSTDQLREIDR